MAGDWIPIRTDLYEDPAVIAIARSVKLDEFAVVGRLVRLWSFLSHQTTDGSLPGIDENYIDTICRRRGFTQAIVQAGWLGRNAAGELQACRYDRWMAESAKKRLADSRSKRIKRSVHSPPLQTAQDVRACEDNLSSLSDLSVGCGGAGEKGMRSESDQWIDFCEAVAVAGPQTPKWFPAWAARHAGRFGFHRPNDPIVFVDWWTLLARIKPTESEMENASHALQMSDKPPKGRPDHPRMLIAAVRRSRQQEQAKSNAKDSKIETPPTPDQWKQLRKLTKGFGTK